LVLIERYSVVLRHANRYSIYFLFIKKKGIRCKGE